MTLVDADGHVKGWSSGGTVGLKNSRKATAHAAELAIRKVSNQEAINYVLNIFGDKMKPIDQQPAINTIAKVLQLFDGNGKGSDLQSARGTAWGLLNSVTEYIDHHKGRDQSRRLDNAWFGKGGDIKLQAYNQALELIAA